MPDNDRAEVLRQQNDAGPHATPDQERAAAKRRAAAGEAPDEATSDKKRTAARSKSRTA